MVPESNPENFTLRPLSYTISLTGNVAFYLDCCGDRSLQDNQTKWKSCNSLLQMFITPELPVIRADFAE